MSLNRRALAGAFAWHDRQLNPDGAIGRAFAELEEARRVLADAKARGITSKRDLRPFRRAVHDAERAWVSTVHGRR